MAEGTKGISLGIDFGTTYSSVSYYNSTGQKYELIQMSKGSTSEPLVIALIDNKGKMKIDFGHVAKMNASKKCSVCDVKRLIGANFSDCYGMPEQFGWQFDLEQREEEGEGDDKDNLNIVLEQPVTGDKMTFQPEEIVAFMLQKLMEITYQKLSSDLIGGIVLAVPVSFSDKQRKSMIKAAEIAGLKVKKVINEPEASLYAYQEYLKSREKKETLNNVVILDLGGGTFDLTCLKREGKKYKVIATCGNNHLGGSDFDSAIMNIIKEKLNECEAFREIFDDPSHLTGKKRNMMKVINSRIRNEAERIKIQFSSSQDESVNIDIETIFMGYDGFDEFDEVEISREEFNESCETHIEMCEDCMNELMKGMNKKGVNKNNLSVCILAGSASKLPAFRDLAKKIFGNKLSEKEFESSTSIAKGLSYINRNTSDCDLDREQIIQTTIGIEKEGGELIRIINKGEMLPKKGSVEINVERGEHELKLNIYEGRLTSRADMKCIWKTTILLNPPPRERITFTIDYEVNEGTITIKATSTKNITQIESTFHYDEDAEIEILRDHMNKYLNSN